MARSGVHFAPHCSSVLVTGLALALLDGALGARLRFRGATASDFFLDWRHNVSLLGAWGVLVGTSAAWPLLNGHFFSLLGRGDL